MMTDPIQVFRDTAFEQSLWDVFDGEIVDFEMDTNIITIQEENNPTKSENLVLNDNALNQFLNGYLGGRGIVNTYGKGAIHEDPALFEYNVKRLIDKRIENRSDNKRIPLARVGFDDGGEVKFLMTQRYYGHTCKNHDIINLFDKEYSQKFDQGWCKCTPDNFYLSISNIKEGVLKNGGGFLTEESNRMYGVGDVIGIGIMVKNSQTGNGSLAVGIFALRKKCDNGQVAPDENTWNTQRHVRPEMFEELKTSVAMIMQNSDFYLNQLENSINRIRCQSIDDIPKVLANANIKKIHHDGIVKQFEIEPVGVLTDGKITNYGAMNATTRYATHVYPKIEGFKAREQHNLLLASNKLLKGGIRI